MNCIHLLLHNSQIVKLTQLVGEVDIQLNTALEENEVLKQRLGMSTEESVDVSELRHKKNVELEELKNINRDLSQEVNTQVIITATICVLLCCVANNVFYGL